MNVLILGSGGREHALAWKISQSPLCAELWLHPGNSGTQRLGFKNLGNVSLHPDAIVYACKKKKIDLVIIGPETLLFQGVSDVLTASQFKVLGPNRKAAQLETSKRFSKEFMVKYGVPTAPFQIVGNPKALFSAVTKYPAVLKFDGLAAGKGVAIARNHSDVEAFAKRVWEDQEFGKQSPSVIVEEFLSGNEISYLGFCDSKTFVPLTSATDYKRLKDNDVGPNTGGMGAISPSPHLTQEIEKKIQKEIVERVLTGIQNETLDYRGVLYIGCLIQNDRPYVLEFNARFGDPETQAILPRWRGDALPWMLATAEGTLGRLPTPDWHDDVSVYVVAVAEDYPENPRSGATIEGLDINVENSLLFFSGVSGNGSKILTSGGRVLGVGAKGDSYENARTLAYKRLKEIHWDGMYYRKDVGAGF